MIMIYRSGLKEMKTTTVHLVYLLIQIKLCEIGQCREIHVADMGKDR